MSQIKATGGIKVSGGLRAGRFNEPPAWDTVEGSLGTPFESQAFSVIPGATDPDSFPSGGDVDYSLTSGSLPSGLTLNAETGEISGTPTAVGSDTLSSFTLRAEDGPIGANLVGKSVERDFTITIIDDNPPNVSPAAGNIGSVAELTAAALVQITATDPNTVTQSITFSEVGANLTTENLSIDSNGNITGTPADSGGTRTLNFTVRASTATNSTDVAYSITITDNQDPVWVTAAGLLDTVNESEAITTITLAATDGNTVSYSVTAGALPGGLTLNSSNGEITGTPSNVASDTTSSFTVRATDTVESDFTDRCFTIKVLNVIVNSLRFNDDDSAELTHGGFTSGNQKTWTWSGWLKRGNLSDSRIFSAGTDSNNRTSLSFQGGVDNFEIFDLAGGVVRTAMKTAAVFRDPSAWYHIVWVWDTSNGTAADRTRLYVNGVRLTDFTPSNNTPELNDNGRIMDNVSNHAIGSNAHVASAFFDGYMSEINFVEGSALEPTSFGAFDTNGDWQPKEYSGAFGTNGFRFDYAVAPGTGNGGGTDVSGNGNHFTDSGLAANDQVTDSPTNNHCTLNPLQLPSNVTLSDGTLTATGSSTGWKNPHASFIMEKNAGGKYYFEVTSTATGTDEIWWGIIPEDETTLISNGTTNGHNTINRRGTASYRDSVVQDSGLTALGDGETGMCAIDLDNEKIWFGREGTWDAGGDPATNTGGITLFGSKDFYYIVVAVFESRDLSVDFGQLGYAETKPTGFDSINSANLPTPTIANPSDHFNPLLYTGNSSNGRVLTGLDFSPDLVWIKNRSNANSHQLYDAVRGVNSKLSSDDASVESTGLGEFTSFDSGGFTLGTADDRQNTTGFSYVAWCWNESATPGFDIVSYTGTGAAHTESHNLGAVPKMMIVKNRDTAAQDWIVYHASNTSAPETDFLKLNEQEATVDNIVVWNDTAPTSTVFTVGTGGSVNLLDDEIIAYLWTEVEGFSKFGSWTGNGSTDGPFVWCGFSPAFIMTKRTDTTSSWLIYDSIRNPSNVANRLLFPEDPSNESVSGADNDILSNGFKPRTTSPTTNANGGTYVFAAFAESPFKTARAR